jgi:hypothetical protein
VASQPVDLKQYVKQNNGGLAHRKIYGEVEHTRSYSVHETCDWDQAATSGTKDPEQTGPDPDTPRSAQRQQKRCRPPLEFLAATGLRASEVAGLIVGDVELNERSGWATPCRVRAASSAECRYTPGPGEH